LEKEQKGVDGQEDIDDSACMRDESTTTNGSETMTEKELMELMTSLVNAGCDLNDVAEMAVKCQGKN